MLNGKSGLVSVQNDVSSATNYVKQIVTAHPIISGATTAVGGAAVGYTIGRKTSKSSRKSYKRSRKNKKHRSKKKSHSRKARRRRYTPHTAGKRKDTSHRRIRYTKRGQPYIIQANGRARFISGKSARISRKRTGGKY